MAEDERRTSLNSLPMLNNLDLNGFNLLDLPGSSGPTGGMGPGPGGGVGLGFVGSIVPSPSLPPIPSSSLPSSPLLPAKGGTGLGWL